MEVSLATADADADHAACRAGVEADEEVCASATTAADVHVPRPERQPLPHGRARLVRGLAEQPLDEHAVLPLAVEPAVAPLDPDLGEAGGEMDGSARGVVGEDARGQLVEARLLRGRGERLEQRRPTCRPRAARAT